MNAVGMSLAWWAALLVVWALLVGTLGPLELLAGMLAAGVATCGWSAVRTRDAVDLALRPQHMAVLVRRLPSRVVLDTGQVFGALGRRLRGMPVHGRVRLIPFDAGARDDPAAAGRRALVVAGISLAPNSVVVRLDAPSGGLLVHELVPGPNLSGASPEWPL